MNTEIKKLFVMRHAESLEDIDKNAYERIADEDMPLSEHGREQVEKERYRTGVLRYKFPDGESGAEMLFRFDLFAKKLKQGMIDKTASNILIITHGFGLRVLLKSLLGWTEEYFESLAHPHHCDLKRLAYDGGMFLLLDEMSIYDSSKNPNFIRR